MAPDMKKNSDRKNDAADQGRWVDDQLAALAPNGEWQPNVARGFARFDERRRAQNWRGHKWIFAVATLAAACVVLLALPRYREGVQRLWRDSDFKSVDIGQVSADVKALKDGQAAPDFTLQDSTGADVRLSAYKGKVVLLNFWATWCGGCQVEIPWLMEFEKKYKDRGFVVIGISMDDDGWKSVKPYLAEKKLNYPVVIGSEKVSTSYGLGSMPMTYLIDREGKVAATSVGIVNKDACEHQIIELLGPSRSN
jgi:peroxiredoxin